MKQFFEKTDGRERVQEKRRGREEKPQFQLLESNFYISLNASIFAGTMQLHQSFRRLILLKNLKNKKINTNRRRMKVAGNQKKRRGTSDEQTKNRRHDTTRHVLHFSP